MPITYYNNIPQAIDQPSQSQGQILQNFIAIDQLIDINHYTFAEANAGKHRFSSMVLQVAAPAAANDEFQIYTKNDAVSTNDELYIRRSANNGLNASAEVPFTTYGDGYTWLPSGLLVKWGNFLTVNPYPTTASTENYPSGATIPAFTDVPLYVQVIAGNSGAGAGIDINAVAYFVSSTATVLTYRVMRRTAVNTSTGQAIRVYWLAVGKGV